MHSDITLSLNNLGLVLEACGNVEEAEVLFRRSLNIRYEIYGQSAAHSDITASLNNLGSVFQARGKLQEAETLYRKCLAMNFENTR